MNAKTICVVTGSRAEYGLLNWVMREIKNDPDLELQILVTGMHLEEKYGATWKEIQADGFEITATAKMLDSENTPTAVANSTGSGVIACARELDRLNPDLVIVLGDRFEVFSAAVAATLLKIPLVHFHGGETTEGAFDESLRHAITKMSHLHFTSTERYRRRVIQLGESPERVFNVGAVGLDNIDRCSLRSRDQLTRLLGISLKPRNVIVTFHPATLVQTNAAAQFQELLDALQGLEDCGIIITHPNADPGSDGITDKIQSFVDDNSDKVWAFSSLGYVNYLSMLKIVDVVVGNSSSGLIEAPHFRIPTVDIGDRQRGRIAGPTVIHCEPDASSIARALETAFSADFVASIQDAVNPYGVAGASKRAVEIIKSFPMSGILLKRFYDLSEVDLQPTGIRS